MRKAAIGILEDEMSEYTLEHIREIDYLEEWIVDAMIKFHESEVKKLNKLDVMAMLPPVTFLEKVNRVEVIDQKGRSYVNCKPTNKTELSLQDDGKTLKVFISNKP